MITLDQAVHKLTAEPAGVYGFHDRGCRSASPPTWCVFDPDTMAPGPIRRVVDFPAGGERLTAERRSG